jgi:flagellar basal-body rod protein FlgF
MQDIAVLASRVLTTEKRFNSVADNIANVNTSGYRKLDIDFKELVSKPQGHPTVSYVADRATYMDVGQGTFQNTGNPLDVAIAGNGYYAISVNGNTQYTRNGQFMLNSEGTLVTQDGYPVLDNSGAQIQVPQDAKGVDIAVDGTVSTDQGQLAPVGVYEFTAEQQNRFTRAGNTRFVANKSDTPTVVEQPTLKQGFIEGSNVNATEEMVNMQMVSKAYEESLKNLRNLEDLEQRVIRNIGAVN